MDKLSALPGGMNSHVHLPSLGQIASDSQFPAYLRMVAMDIAEENYSTVGSILSNICPQDLTSILGSWMSQINAAKEEDSEDGALLMRVSNPATFSYLLFTMLIAKAEAGDTRFDPVSSGFQAELLSTFMQALIVANQFDRVKLDLTQLTLSWDFLDLDFDYVLSTDNFKALKFVNELKKVWRKMQKSEPLTLARGPREPVKEDLVRAPAAVSKFKSRVAKFRSADLDIDLNVPDTGPEGSKDKLRRARGD